VVVVLVTLTFVPMRWLHPMRFRRLRTLNVTVMAAWFLAAAQIVAAGFPASPWACLVLGAVAVYGIALTLSLPFAKPSSRPKP
jgi:phosphatidylcholine synthase